MPWRRGPAAMAGPGWLERLRAASKTALLRDGNGLWGAEGEKDEEGRGWRGWDEGPGGGIGLPARGRGVGGGLGSHTRGWEPIRGVRVAYKGMGSHTGVRVPYKGTGFRTRG